MSKEKRTPVPEPWREHYVSIYSSLVKTTFGWGSPFLDRISIHEAGIKVNKDIWHVFLREAREYKEHKQHGRVKAYADPRHDYEIQAWIDSEPLAGTDHMRFLMDSYDTTQLVV